MSRIIRTEKRRRGFLGWLIKLTFIALNLVMFAWMASYWTQIAEYEAGASEAARTGAALGSIFGTSMILIMWAAGAVILGLLTLLTRGRVTVVEERIE